MRKLFCISLSSGSTLQTVLHIIKHKRRALDHSSYANRHLYTQCAAFKNTLKQKLLSENLVQTIQATY